MQVYECSNQQSDVVRHVFHYAVHTQNPDLIVLFMYIKKAMSNKARICERYRRSFYIYWLQKHEPAGRYY